MRKVREVLRLKFECRRSHAEIAASVGIGETTVGDYLARARRAELTWEHARELGDAEIEARLFRDGGPQRAVGARAGRLSVGAS